MVVTSNTVPHGRYTTIRQGFHSEVQVCQEKLWERSLGGQGQQGQI